MAASDSSSASALRAAAALRGDILSHLAANLNLADVDADADDEDDPIEEEDVVDEEEAADAVVRCLDSAMSLVVAAASSKKNKKKDATWSESVGAILELASAFACGIGVGCAGGGGGGSSSSRSKAREGGEGGGEVALVVARAVVERAAEYAAVEGDAIRTEACRFLGLCARRLIEGGSGSGSGSIGIGGGNAKKGASILKNGRGGNGKSEGKIGGNSIRLASSGNDNGVGSNAAVAAASWRGECLLLAARALLPRITDKIAKVRSSAISACSSLLVLAASEEEASGTAKTFFGNGDEGGEELRERFGTVMTKIRKSLLWILANDTSALNRASVASVVLPPLSGGPARRDEDEIDIVVQSIIGRIGDSDVRVRAAALGALRDLEGTTELLLTEDRRVEILGKGLTRR